MSTKGVAIIGNSFDTYGCGRGKHDVALAVDFPTDDAQVHITDRRVSCGHCGEVIYPELSVMANHKIVCDGQIECWFLYDGPPHAGASLLMVVHRCGWPTMTATDAELLDLTRGAQLA